MVPTIDQSRTTTDDAFVVQSWLLDWVDPARITTKLGLRRPRPMDFPHTLNQLSTIPTTDPNLPLQTVREPESTRSQRSSRTFCGCIGFPDQRD